MACLPTMARIRADLQATAGMLYIIVLRQMWRWRAAGDDWARHVPGAYESHASSLDAHANPPLALCSRGIVYTCRMRTAGQDRHGC